MMSLKQLKHNLIRYKNLTILNQVSITQSVFNTLCVVENCFSSIESSVGSLSSDFSSDCRIGAYLN